jgi:Cof subfamily protein (haloacid dehalogenase superfamily)
LWGSGEDKFHSVVMLCGYNGQMFNQNEVSMPIKLIAVDMDGTFLDDNKNYNKSRFLEQYQELVRRGVHFVAASGNPLYTLKHYFAEIADQIGYVAENGAYVMDGQQELGFQHFSSATVQAVLDCLLPDYEAALILCGKNQGMVSQHVPAQAMSRLQIYFKRLQRYADLGAITDQICKITINSDDCDLSQLHADLAKHRLLEQHPIKMVSSGFGFIDLIVPGQHKAQGLSLLQRRWQVDCRQVLAIGDNHNDIELIDTAGYGFAMANAVPALKAVAKYHAPSNTQQGVLQVIDQFLEAKPPFCA